MQLLYHLQQSKILKHVSTRWLSAGKCLPLLIDNWNALYSFFKAEEKNAVGSIEQEKTKMLRKTFQSPTNRLYCMFLLDVIKVSEVVNTAASHESKP
ncbi:uncharacterized protein LOC143284765 [Babylonia areolata]|uniref:uncharacterized protein LOC143284765 n=1 Tax=Babylonia areolata TaxID=304850 RepID=UPI003FD176BC